MNVLPDTSVWIDHLRRGEPELERSLELGHVVTHSAVVGELACGTLRDRGTFLAALLQLPAIAECSPDEALHMVEAHRLWGRGLCWVDALLLASCLIAGTRLWTRDRALAAAAGKLRIAHKGN